MIDLLTKIGGVRSAFVFAVFYCFLIIFSYSASALDPGARIIGTNCIPDPKNAEERKRDCKALNIWLNDYEVEIKFKPTGEFIALMGTVVAGAVGGTTGGVVDKLGGGGYATAAITVTTASTVYGRLISLQTNPKNLSFRANERKNIDWILSFMPIEARLEGSNICLYIMPIGLFQIPVPKSAEKMKGRDEGIPDHCVEAPPPYVVKQTLDWGRLISKACTDHCEHYDHDANPYTPERTACYDHDLDCLNRDQLLRAIKAADENAYAKALEDVEEGKTAYKATYMALYNTALASWTPTDRKTGNPLPNCTTGSDKTFPIKAAVAHSDFPMSSVIMQCVQETMTNIMYKHEFTYQDGRGNTVKATYFAQMQHNLRIIVQALLVLYLIMIGYRFILEKGIKRNDGMWIIVKMAVVIFFSTQNGMMLIYDLLPKAVQEAAYIVMNPFDSAEKAPSPAMKEAAPAGCKSEPNVFKLVECQLNHAKVERELKYELMFQARRSLFIARNTPATDPADIEAKTKALDKADDELIEATRLLEAAELNHNALGYDFCKFNVRNRADADRKLSQFDYRYYEIAADGTTDRYNYDISEANGEIRSMSEMRVWDSVDCRIAKFIGLGENENNRDMPQIFVIGTTAFGSPVGSGSAIVIFLFIAIFLVFVIMLTVRMVMIFLFAFMALVLLIYISPIIFPALLFERTKDIFNKWLKQMVSYSLQPLIMFAFLSFLFFAVESIFYGGNYFFNYDNNMKGVVPGTDATQTCDLKEDARCVCQDPETIACVYHLIKFGDRKKNDTSDDFSFTKLELTDAQATMMVKDLFFMVALCFLLYNVVAQVEDMSKTITDAAGGGAAGLAKGGAVSPFKIGQAAAMTGAAPVMLGAKGAGAAFGLAKEYKGRRAARLDKEGGSGPRGFSGMVASRVAGAGFGAMKKGQEVQDLGKKALDAAKVVKAAISGDESAKEEIKSKVKSTKDKALASVKNKATKQLEKDKENYKKKAQTVKRGAIAVKKAPGKGAKAAKRGAKLATRGAVRKTRAGGNRLKSGAISIVKSPLTLGKALKNSVKNKVKETKEKLTSAKHYKSLMRDTAANVERWAVQRLEQEARAYVQKVKDYQKMLNEAQETLRSISKTAKAAKNYVKELKDLAEDQGPQAVLEKLLGDTAEVSKERGEALLDTAVGLAKGLAREYGLDDIPEDVIAGWKEGKRKSGYKPRESKLTSDEREMLLNELSVGGEEGFLEATDKFGLELAKELFGDDKEKVEEEKEKINALALDVISAAASGDSEALAEATQALTDSIASSALEIAKKENGSDLINGLLESFTKDMEAVLGEGGEGDGTQSRDVLRAVMDSVNSGTALALIGQEIEEEAKERESAAQEFMGAASKLLEKMGVVPEGATEDITKFQMEETKADAKEAMLQAARTLAKTEEGREILKDLQSDLIANLMEETDGDGSGKKAYRDGLLAELDAELSQIIEEGEENDEKKGLVAELLPDMLAELAMVEAIESLSEGDLEGLAEAMTEFQGDVELLLQDVELKEIIGEEAAEEFAKALEGLDVDIAVLTQMVNDPPETMDALSVDNAVAASMAGVEEKLDIIADVVVQVSGEERLAELRETLLGRLEEVAQAEGSSEEGMQAMVQRLDAVLMTSEEGGDLTQDLVSADAEALVEVVELLQEISGELPEGAELPEEAAGLLEELNEAIDAMTDLAGQATEGAEMETLAAEVDENISKIGNILDALSDILPEEVAEKIMRHLKGDKEASA